MKKVKWTLLGGVATFVVAIVLYKLIVLAGGYMMDGGSFSTLHHVSLTRKGKKLRNYM